MADESRAFESDVISDGTQTLAWRLAALAEFESDVISDGTQTINLESKSTHNV